MTFRLEVVLHGEGECPAAGFEFGYARGSGVIGRRNTDHWNITSATGSSRSAYVRESVGALAASRSERGSVTDESCVVILEADLIIGIAAGQVELGKWVIQEVDSRDAELQLLSLRDLEVLEQRQITVKVSWTAHVGPCIGTLRPVSWHPEAAGVEMLTRLQPLGGIAQQGRHEQEATVVW